MGNAVIRDGLFVYIHTCILYSTIAYDCAYISKALRQRRQRQLIGTVRSNPLPRAALFLEQYCSSRLPPPLVLLLASLHSPLVLPLESSLDLWQRNTGRGWPHTSFLLTRARKVAASTSKMQMMPRTRKHCRRPQASGSGRELCVAVVAAASRWRC